MGARVVSRDGGLDLPPARSATKSVDWDDLANTSGRRGPTPLVPLHDVLLHAGERYAMISA